MAQIFMNSSDQSLTIRNNKFVHVRKHYVVMRCGGTVVKHHEFSTLAIYEYEYSGPRSGHVYDKCKNLVFFG